jgi:hypothetical protein
MTGPQKNTYKKSSRSEHGKRENAGVGLIKVRPQNVNPIKPMGLRGTRRYRGIWGVKQYDRKRCRRSGGCVIDIRCPLRERSGLHYKRTHIRWGQLACGMHRRGSVRRRVEDFVVASLSEGRDPRPDQTPCSILSWKSDEKS